MYKKERLNNGLRVVSHRMPGRESLALGVWIKAGGRYETTQNKGISHFLEHLVFKGTKKYSCRQIKESIEGIGGSLNGFTSEELTCYLVKIPADYLERALGILSDMVINPIIPAAEVKKEKHVILEELKMYKDLPQAYVYDLLDELLWPGHPLGMPVIGTVESVSAVTRESLRAFQQRLYNPANIVVSAAGNLDYSKFSKSVSSIFSRLPGSDKSAFVAARQAQAKPQLKVFVKDTEQTHLALGFHSFRRDHPLKHALGMLHIILGANMSSRLFNEVREKRGLAYEIGTVVKRFQDTGAFIVHAGIDNRKVDEALKLVLRELRRIKYDLVTEDEFIRAKEFYTGQLRMALEDTMDHMLWIGESVAALGKTQTLNDIIREVSAVRRADIREAASGIFDRKRMNLALVGPLKGKEGMLYKQLSLG